MCLVFPCERGAVGTGRRADVGGELQQRGASDGGDVHVIAVCWLPTRRQRQAHPLLRIRSLPSTFTSTLNLHLYPQPPPLPSTLTSSLNLPFYPPPQLLPPISTSVLHIHLHPRPPNVM